MAGGDSLRCPASLPSSTRTTQHASGGPAAPPAINSPPSALNYSVASPDGVGGFGGGLACDPGDQSDDAGCVNGAGETCCAGFAAGHYGLSGTRAAIGRVDWAERSAGNRTAQAHRAPAQKRGATGTGHGLTSDRADGEIRSSQPESNPNEQ